jgi:putative PIN family toxin of toxin-antitoxin system
MYQIILDTNVLVAALKSRKGASFKLLSLIDSGKFEVNLSVPLFLEYEDVLKRKDMLPHLAMEDIDNVLDYICKQGNRKKIFYLWRPFLKDPKDDFVLELAVEAGCDYIITYNLKDFEGINKFGVKAITPKEFLKIIGGL